MGEPFRRADLELMNLAKLVQFQHGQKINRLLLVERTSDGQRSQGFNIEYCAKRSNRAWFQLYTNMLDETSMESRFLKNAPIEMSSPFLEVSYQQSIGPAFGFQGLGTERLSASPLHLGPDERGPVGLAVF